MAFLCLLPILIRAQGPVRKVRAGINLYNLYNSTFLFPNFIGGFNLQLLNERGSGPYFIVNCADLVKEAKWQITPPYVIKNWRTKAFLIEGGYNFYFPMKFSKVVSTKLGLGAGHYYGSSSGNYRINNKYFPDNSYTQFFDEEMQTFFVVLSPGLHIEINKLNQIELSLIGGMKSKQDLGSAWSFEDTPILGLPAQKAFFRLQMVLWFCKSLK